MAMHHYLRLSFIFLFVITSFICVYFIIKKRRNRKGPKLLSKEKYSSSMGDEMAEISVSNDSLFNIWPYISELKAAKILSNKVKESELIYKVYRNSTEDFEHVLLATEKENHFVKVVVDRNKKKPMGYLFLDL
jgi:serine/threonine-protein kinase RIO1